MKRSTILGGLACALAFAFGARAHIRILHPLNGNPLSWSTPESVGIAISPLTPSGVADGSHVTALRSSIEAWNRTPGSVARLVEEPAAEDADWNSDYVHLIRFEKDNASGYFPFGSGTVAVTPIYFYSSGLIADADILFNDGAYAFSTDQQSGTFDIGDVATHELGHFLGLDHSGVAGATMYPYVERTGVLHRSLSIDDLNGVRESYPGQSFAAMTGTVERADGSPVFGAHLVARDGDGRLVGATLSDAAGEFRFAGLEGGSYRVLALPLDAPVSGANLTGGPSLHTDFQPTDLPGVFAVAAGAERALGTLVVEPDAALQLGRSSDSLPVRAILGQEITSSLRGAGLEPGCTLEASDPAVTVTPVNWLDSFVSFRVDVPSDETLGHCDLIVTNPGGDRAVLAGAIEITPPDPIVNVVAPGSGSDSGGTEVVLQGSNFRAGLRVVIGDRIYAEGEPGGATLNGPGELRLTTLQTVGGLHDVVVIDASGVEGRLEQAFQSAQIPVVENVFPDAGSTAGGTTVTVTGEEFADGAEVRLDGVLQANTTVVEAGQLTFETAGSLAAGEAELTVTNPGGVEAVADFALVAAPDLALAAVEPGVGPAGGGEWVELSGSDFPSDPLDVRFGADPTTGEGGTAARSVERIDASTLRVETPAGSGVQAVLVRNLATGQADLLEEAFTFQGGSGGGGCTTALPGSGGDASRRGALFAWGLAALIAALAGALGGGRRTPSRQALG